MDLGVRVSVRVCDFVFFCWNLWCFLGSEMDKSCCQENLARVWVWIVGGVYLG
jgi:hypothetical protein